MTFTLVGLVNFVIYLIIVGGVCWLLVWLVDYCTLPQPFNKVAKVVIAVVGVLICISALLGGAHLPVFIR